MILEPRQSRRGYRTAGLTLVEVMISLGLAGLFATALVSISLSTGRSLAEMVNYADLDHVNRVALDHLSRELRQVRYMTAFSANKISFVDYDGLPLTYEYSPAAQALLRDKNGTTRLLLQHCSYLRFDIYQRTPLSNSFDLIPTTEITNCKVISATWNCTRPLIGSHVNSQGAQAAHIVVRNKKEE